MNPKDRRIREALKHETKNRFRGTFGKSDKVLAAYIKESQHEKRIWR